MPGAVFLQARWSLICCNMSTTEARRGDDDLPPPIPGDAPILPPLPVVVSALALDSLPSLSFRPPPRRSGRIAGRANRRKTGGFLVPNTARGKPSAVMWLALSCSPRSPATPAPRTNLLAPFDRPQEAADCVRV